MIEQLVLLPAPRHLRLNEGTYPIPDGKLIVLDCPEPQRLRLVAGRLQQALRQRAGVEWQLVAGSAVPADQVGLSLAVVPVAALQPQGYQLAITPNGISITAGTAAGAFYGGLTLLQIIEQAGPALPLLQVSDWPDFPNRGVMLDVSRDKVPTMATLLELVDRLASWKINQLQLYTEHTFAYRNHPEVWAAASPMTGEEILTLDHFCRERFIELVPNQNTFGHMRRWLVHDRYRALAECPAGCDTGDPEWGYLKEPFSLCPEEPGSLELVRSLMDELLPHFSSRQFNVGCDETVDLGQGRSAEAVARRGRGRVYLDFLLRIYREVKRRGFTMQFWGDMIMTHPELVPELPLDVVALEWGYEANHPFEEHGARFALSGIPFYVCPGTSSWNSIAGRAGNALENLRSAARNGLRYGASGYLIADWGDNGHWQPLPASYLAFVYGAALAWAYEANLEQDPVHLTSLYAFGDPTGRLGRLGYDLGNAYLEPGVLVHNNSLLFKLLQESPAEIAAREGLTIAGLQKTLAYLARFDQALADVQAGRPEGDLLLREFRWMAGMLGHACRRGMWALGGGEQHQDEVATRRQLADEIDQLIAEHTAIWLARNRPGGLPDSVARLKKMVGDYG